MKKRLTALVLTGVLCLSGVLTGCGKGNENTNTPTTNPSPTTETQNTPAITPDAGRDPSVKPTDTQNYIELALNVYYNDADNSYYANELASTSIFVTEAGQYTLTFDCATDLSDAAKSAGVKALKNLTAIYILDAGVAKGAQSPLKAAMIKYDKVVIDGTELTVTQTAPKKAFKSSGIFDTNDPINSWDGCQVEEVDVDTSNHVANFLTSTAPTKVSVTFTLSDLDWGNKPADPTPVPTQGASAGDHKNEHKFSTLDLKNMTAVELSKLMGNGINLGNTMEAYGKGSLGTGASVSSYETFWGQPITTAAMIQGMKDCGFDTIRIPVAWTNMMDYANDNFTINTKLLDRVEEIVKYAIVAEMRVIVNDHWDGGWWGMFGSKTPATVDKAWKIYTEMWTQVATRFKDYSDMLIFESANEELGPGLNENTVCPDSGFLTENQTYEMANAINQKFVDIVRSTGGNNTDRFLLIAGINTNIAKTLDSRFKMPTDSANHKLFVSVHYYDPWNYCGVDKQSKWGLKNEYQYMNDTLKQLTKFTDAGYGVIIGEYGALPYYENNVSNVKNNTAEYTCHMLDNCDLYNLVPVLWDTNGLYHKQSLGFHTDFDGSVFTTRGYQEEKAMGEEAYIAKVKKCMSDAMAAAPEMWEGVETYEPGTPVAWIMWNGGAGTYSVGDVFNPADNTEGIKATNAIIEGAGTYTVSLDFAGGNNGLTFAAIGLADGELLYPNCVIHITKITLDGVEYKMKGLCYTSSDDGKCTRVNLLNPWVSKPADDARTIMGSALNATPQLLDATDMVGIKNITITFNFVVK